MYSFLRTPCKVTNKESEEINILKIWLHGKRKRMMFDKLNYLVRRQGQINCTVPIRWNEKVCGAFLVANKLYFELDTMTCNIEKAPHALAF